MLSTKIILMPETDLWVFRHGHSRSNRSKDRSLLFPRLVSLAYKHLGRETAFQLTHFIDLIREKHTPYSVGDKNTPLEPIGHTQAYMTGLAMPGKGIHPNIILCSTHFRTRQTAAEIIAGYKQVTDKTLPIIYMDFLVERNSGTTHGFPRAYYSVLFPKSHALYAKDKYAFRPPGGESMIDVQYNRIRPNIHKELAKHKGVIAIVGHGLTNSTINAELTGKDIRKVRLGSPNLGVYNFKKYWGQKLWKISDKYDGSTPLVKMVETN
ncbi:MAG: histidine phosphatase family protein [Candidatus Margulisiibacteriota bacterium]